MNRLILLGNGFDLAHGMKTTYNDFLKWYLTNCFEYANVHRNFEDVMIRVERNKDTEAYNIPTVKTTADLIELLYQHEFQVFAQQNTVINMAEYGTQTLPFKVTFKSLLIQKLLQNCSEIKWVDIERTFYTLLILFGKKDALSLEQIARLNASMAFLIEQLSKYLSGLPAPPRLILFEKLFWEPFHAEERIKKQIRKNKEIEQLMILNFNYTNTAEQYLGQYISDINYIHGNIHDEKNPIIFGFGDELDKNYQLLESANNNSLLKYIKSFGYLKTDNYTNLIRFIQAGEYQIYVIGHSCGLSDRTMLHTLFENTNCVSIRIFYYEDKSGGNNFETLTQEISRHFKDKEIMRERIVKFPHTARVPQYDD